MSWEPPGGAPNAPPPSQSVPAHPPPGWYSDAGHWRWWDGRQWGAFAPPAAAPGPGYPPPVPMGWQWAPVRSDEQSGKTLAIFVHLWLFMGAALACLAFFFPLVIYVLKPDNNRFARFHAGEAANVAFTALVVWLPLQIWAVVALPGSLPDGNSNEFPLQILWFYVPGLLLAVYGIGCGIFGAIKASRGEWVRQPLAIPFLRAHRRELASPSIGPGIG